MKESGDNESERERVQEKKFKWYVHVMRREEHYVGRMTM